MARGRTRRVLMIGGFAIGVLLFAVNIACLPFYSGASVRGAGGWRLEHGRLTVWRSEVTAGEGFYVANNAEGLRWKPDGRVVSLGEWRLTVPLWMGWAAMFAGAGVLWWRARETASFWKGGMMTRDHAISIGQAIVDAMAGGAGRWRVVESSVREVSFGWVLWYNSTGYLDGDLSKGLYGPGPMCFNKVTWDIKNFGSLTTLEEAIAECERCWRANSAAWKASASGG